MFNFVCFLCTRRDFRVKAVLNGGDGFSSGLVIRDLKPLMRRLHIYSFHILVRAVLLLFPPNANDHTEHVMAGITGRAEKNSMVGVNMVMFYYRI